MFPEEKESIMMERGMVASNKHVIRNSKWRAHIRSTKHREHTESRTRL